MNITCDIQNITCELKITCDILNITSDNLNITSDITSNNNNNYRLASKQEF
jgi:hypothetical protein